MCTIISIPKSPFRPRELYLNYFTYYLKKINKMNVLGNAKNIISRHLYFSYCLSRLGISHIYILASFYKNETLEFKERSRTSFIKKQYLNLQARLQENIEKEVIKNKNINIVVLSKMRSRELFSLYGERSRVIYPGVDQNVLLSKRNKLNHNLLIHCRHEARKNLKKYFEEVEINKDIYKDLKINVIGHGPETKHLTKQINDSNFLKERVTVHGFVDNIDPFYREADLLIFPTIQEGFGQVIQESMVRGVPVVCYKDVETPFTEFIEHETTGYLVNFYEQDSISRKVEAIYKDSNQYFILVKNLHKMNFKSWGDFIKEVTSY